MIKEYEKVVLIIDLPEYDLKAGDLGTVVHIYNDGQGYELEFFTVDGETLELVTVEANQILPVNHRDILHVRELSA